MYASAIREVAEIFPFFTIDHVRDHLHIAHPYILMGDIAGALKKLANEGVISRTTFYEESSRPEAKRRPIRIWKSNVFSLEKAYEAHHAGV